MTRSAAMQALAVRLQQVIRSPKGVLLYGEPGTDFQQLARAIHLATEGDHDTSLERLLRQSMSPGVNGRPFVIVDCSEPDDLEIRVFGARSDRGERAAGDLETVGEASALCRALGGTLLLKQLPDMPARLQHRLARVLRDGEAWVLTAAGELVARPVAVRAIATSQGTADDERLVPELNQRLEHTRIEVPPLRNRREDIPELARQLLEDICAELRVPAKTASTQALELLSALPWRRNLDELRCFLSTLVKKVPGRLIRQSDILANVRLDGAARPAAYGGTLKQARAQFERDYVAAVLQQHHGRMAEAAKALGIQRTNLYRKIRQLAVKRRPPRRNGELDQA